MQLTAKKKDRCRRQSQSATDKSGAVSDLGGVCLSERAQAN